MAEENPQAGEGWSDDDFCFACGRSNPHGLHLEFKIEDGKIRTSYLPEKKFQGYADVFHGGMIGLILDETMVNLPWKLFGTPVVSAELTFRLKAPARIGERLFFTAEMEPPRGRLILTRGEARREDGTLVAEATAKCMKVSAQVQPR